MKSLFTISSLLMLAISFNANAFITEPVAAAPNTYQVDEIGNDGGLSFSLSVGEGVSPITVFAVGFMYDEDMGDEYGDEYSKPSAYTSISGWAAEIGSANDWNEGPFGISWDAFLGFDPDSAASINRFALYTAEAGAGLDSSNTPSGYNFHVEMMGAMPQSPAVVLNTGGTFGGSVGQNNLAVNAVPEPTSLALLGLGLAGFGFSRKKRKV